MEADRRSDSPPSPWALPGAPPSGTVFDAGGPVVSPVIAGFGHVRIGTDVEPSRPGPDAAVPAHTLPPDRDDFIGRDQELHLVTTAVAGAARTGGVAAIHAIDGMPGIGRTTLAVHLAGRLADQLPDGLG
jgi:hypothetical protein